MAWVNPETFDVLEHQVVHRPNSIAEWTGVCDWCDSAICEQNVLWAQTGAEMQISRCWWFKSEEDAVLFKLTWL